MSGLTHATLEPRYPLKFNVRFKTPESHRIEEHMTFLFEEKFEVNIFRWHLEGLDDRVR